MFLYLIDMYVDYLKIYCFDVKCDGEVVILFGLIVGCV